MARDELHPQLLDAERALLDRWHDDLAAGAARVGWKVGHDIAEVEDAIGIQPVVGYLTTATLLHDGSTFVPTRPRALRAEIEIALELGDTVAADATAADIERAIAGMSVALELVDVGRPPDDLHGIVAGNVFHRAVVVGPTRAGTRPQYKTAGLTVDAAMHPADHEPADMVVTVRAVARVLEACGERLLPGDRILSGSLVHVPVDPGNRIVAEIEGLGRVAARIAP